MNHLSAHASLIIFICSTTSLRSFSSEEMAVLCDLTLPETEQALKELEHAGIVSKSAARTWEAHPDSTPVQPVPPLCSHGVPLFCLRLWEGRRLDAVSELLSWMENRQEESPSSVLEFAMSEVIHVLRHAPLRDYGEKERSHFIELAIRTSALADLQGQIPNDMRVLLLKARGMARILRNASYIYILDTILDVRKILFDNQNVPLREETAHLVPEEVHDKTHVLTDAAPYLSMYNYLQGSVRQALDHFSLSATNFLPLQFGSGEKNAVPQGAYTLTFAALAAVQFGDAGLALSMLKAGLNRNARRAGCPTLSWIHSHLATVYLATGDPDKALPHVDAALSVGLGQNVQSWMAAHTALAHYHILQGHPGKAHRVLARAVQEAATRRYRWGYSSPWFLDMLYVFRRNGLPDLPGYDLEQELQHCEQGKNSLLKAVAGRIRGDMLFRAGRSLSEVQLPLLRSRAFFKQQQLFVEKCKTCAVLAQACLAAGEQTRALRYAIEAWPRYQVFQALGIYWSSSLDAIMPKTKGHISTERDAVAEGWRQTFMRALLELNPDDCEHFPRELLKCVSDSFGARRACLFGMDDSGAPSIIDSMDVTREYVFGEDGNFPLYLVEECLEGVPVCINRAALGLSDGREADWQLACIPVSAEENGRIQKWALYMETENFRHPGVMEESFLLSCGELFGVSLRRWHAALENAVQENTLGQGRNEVLPHRIVYSSAAMERALEQADIAALSDASVLIYGESGVGKELVARRIHEKSGRRGAFVAVNLSSLPEDLFESEMLGYERGAFTGAFSRKTGLLEKADGGTLFLDEVPDISPRIQVKLLRLLQDRNFMRLGSTRVLHSDFRLVVATNRNLFEEMKQGRFRHDLFYRICVVSLFIPPLRERQEDIRTLIDYYLEYFSRRHGREKPSMQKEDFLRLCSYGWPGNIRELKNVMERAVIFSRGGKAFFSFDEEGFSGASSFGMPQGGGPSPVSPERLSPQADRRSDMDTDDMIKELLCRFPSVKELEKQYIQVVLRMTGGKISGRNGAAALLGIPRSTLYDRMKGFGIALPDTSASE